MIRNERLRIPEEDGYKKGGRVKGKKKAKKGTKKRNITGKTRRGKKMVLPQLTTGSLGTGVGSYQATIGAGGAGAGAFQAPSYFRAVGSSEQYGVVPPVLKEFVEQQKKMWEQFKTKTPDATPDATPKPKTVKTKTPPSPMSSSSEEPSGG
jgi:hypothetical protein